MNAPTNVDVAILGGGLAGLALALQLVRKDPALRVAVLERRCGLAPDAAFKIGESTVEIGAYYFSHTLGLRAHLEEEQIGKFGFRFFFSDGCEDLHACTELGVSQAMPTASWQIDRGRFENFLVSQVRALGVEVIQGALVRGIDLGEGDGHHAVRYTCAGVGGQVQAHWLVDASGRAALLKRKLGLARENDHNVNAVWWRVEGTVGPDHWCDDAHWHARCTPPERWRSTNHLCGPGYWVWMIPLVSGAHSIGIVCDEAQHPLETMNTHDKAMRWLRLHQPRLARALNDGGHALMDFAFLRHFSHSCARLFDGRARWAITGEAGLFPDPFYSPGSDYIGISNTLVADLIARDRAGEPAASHAAVYEQLLQNFYSNTMALYQGQYALFGDAQVMPLKVIWDYTFYWSLLAPLFMGEKLTNMQVIGRIRPAAERACALNLAMQAMLRDWGACNAAAPAPPTRSRLLDQYGIGWFRELNGGLADRLDDTAFVERAHAHIVRMERLASEILAHARAQHMALSDHGLETLLREHSADELLDAAWYEQAA